MTDKPSLSTFFDRFAAIALALVGSLGVRMREGAVAWEVGEAVSRRIRGVRGAMDRLFLRIVDGSLEAWLLGRARRSGFRVPARVAVRPGVSLPRRVGWLCPLIPCTARYQDSGGLHAGRLAALLAEPAVRQILAENPALGLALRPMCRMLGVDEALYLNVKAPSEEELAQAAPFVPPPAPPPDPPPPAIGGVIPWYHQKWAQ